MEKEERDELLNRIPDLSNKELLDLRMELLKEQNDIIGKDPFRLVFTLAIARIDVLLYDRGIVIRQLSPDGVLFRPPLYRLTKQVGGIK